MAVKGISIHETVDFVSKYDPDKENPTLWEIGILDSLTKSKIEDMSTVFEVDGSAPDSAKAKTTLNLNDANIDTVRFGLKGFKNFPDPQTGKDIEFKRDIIVRFGKQHHVVSNEVLRVIPIEILNELAGEIAKRSKLSPKEEKN